MLLPLGRATARPPATLTWNDSGKFEDRWVRLDTVGTKCVFFAGIERCTCRWPTPKASSCPRTEQVLDELEPSGQLVLRYGPRAGGSRDDGRGRACRIRTIPTARWATWPAVCDATGRVCGLMPHPERHVDPTQHPRWTAADAGGRGRRAARVSQRGRLFCLAGPREAPPLSRYWQQGACCIIGAGDIIISSPEIIPPPEPPHGSQQGDC